MNLGAAELAAALGSGGSSCGADVPALLRQLLSHMQAPASQQPPGGLDPAQDTKQQADQASGLSISQLTILHSQLGQLQGGLEPLLLQALGQQQHAQQQHAQQQDAAVLQASAAQLIAQVHAGRAGSAGGWAATAQLLPAVPSVLTGGSALDFLAKFAFPDGAGGAPPMPASLWQEPSLAFAGSASKAGAARRGTGSEEQPGGGGSSSPPTKRVRWHDAGSRPQAGNAGPGQAAPSDGGAGAGAGQADWEEALQLVELSCSGEGGSAATETFLKEQLQALRQVQGASRHRQEAAIAALVEALLGSQNKRHFAELYRPWLGRAPSVRLARECSTLLFYMAMAEAGMEWQAVRRQALAYLQGSMRRMLHDAQQAAAAAAAAAAATWAAGADSKAPEQAQGTTPAGSPPPAGTATSGPADACAPNAAALPGRTAAVQAEEATSSSTGGGAAGGDDGNGIDQSSVLAAASGLPAAARAAC